MEAAQLIGIDWGSTRLRAFLIDGSGAVIETRASDEGVDRLQGEAAFAGALGRIVSGWPALPTLACGVVGARFGWREMAYVPCPAGAAQIAAGMFKLEAGPWLVPGVAEFGAHPDVMRGEETQILGALFEAPKFSDRACFVLPGTHSKWVEIEGGRISSVATHQSGELYGLLRQHSVLKRLIPEPDVDRPAAFIAGVEASRDSGGRAFTQILFGVRARHLVDALPAEDMADYLSGLLIGHEITCSLPLRRDAAAPLVLVGDPALCERYVCAFACFGVTPTARLGNTAARGLWRLAREKELISS
ncbi:2-dehydro-3-deoxygalactonokinase [Burkholderiaceae bacterium UC74_6]